ncbi:MAG: hypothetical protein M0Q38_13985 [Bacteroidales bacterium]|nr:hypothetical protein [Bacteroidales bacterium]
MEANEPNEEIQDFTKGYLTLPFDEDQFRDFITGLLGKPQTITKRISGDFEIHLKDLQNFHDLLTQRIIQQNNGKLVQLKTKIYYSDDSSVLLSSYEELLTYNEVKPVISVAVRMTWIYLIQFADKRVPEKQEIELMIVSTSQRNIIEDEDIPFAFSDDGEFRISIQHTARSWGSDIEGLLTNQINSLIKQKSRIKEFLRKHSVKIGLIIGSLFMIGALIGTYITYQNFDKTEIVRIQTFLQKPTLTIDDKIDFLIKYSASNLKDYFSIKIIIFFIFSLIVSIVLGVWVESLADNKMRSYLVLTREALKLRDKLEDKRKKKTLMFCLSILISIASSVIANYIFIFFTKTN